MSNDKIFCGSGKKIEFQNGGSKMRLAFTEGDLSTMRNNMDNGWVNVEVCQKREPKQGKPTHYCAIDTWKPEGKREQPRTDVNDPAAIDGGEPVKEADPFLDGSEGNLPF